MKQAVRLRKIPYNPCEGVVLPKLKRYRAKVYDIEMINHLLDISKDTDMYIPILLGVSVGLRRGEMLALRWENVDFDAGVIKVRESMARGENGSYIICFDVFETHSSLFRSLTLVGYMFWRPDRF